MKTLLKKLMPALLLAISCFFPLAARAVDVTDANGLISALTSCPPDITVTGPIFPLQSITIPAGCTVTISVGYGIMSGNNLTNNGTIINNGTIVTVGITNDGTITNNGTITIDGTLTNNNTITNNGTITAQSIDNHGTITGNPVITAPDAPTGVTATAGDGQVILTFTTPDDGGSAITGYTVRSSSPFGIMVTGTGSPIIVTGLTNGTAYTFTVTASNIAGESDDSAVTSAATPMGVPDAPTSVTATAGDGRATVSFTPPANTGGGAIINYTVTSSPGGITATGTGSPITVAGLTNGTAYTFTVTASNAVSTSASSAPSSAVTPMALPASTAPIPTLGEWVLALLALLLAGGAAARMRRGR